TTTWSRIEFFDGHDDDASKRRIDTLACRWKSA
ncbi:hypothetical protein CEXT_762771, partial [Caerostris extrusa]